MQFSLVIPAHNAGRDIRQCLEAIFASDIKDFEVIVVDDGSADDISWITREFPLRLISLPVNHGPAYARAEGSRESRGDTLIFIDSDVVIRNGTLSEVKRSFDEDPGIAAVVGILSRTHPNSNFFSVYKNLYMHYVLRKCPRYVGFIYGSFFAVKKEHFVCPDVNRRFGEDAEIGIKLNNSGLKILLNKELEVVHLKKHTFATFIKNDFTIPYHWAELFVLFKGWDIVIKKKGFLHANIVQLLSLMLAPVILLGIFIHPIILLFPVFIILNHQFFVFLCKERGAWFAIRAVFVAWLDMLVMDLGIICGLIAMLLKRRQL